MRMGGTARIWLGAGVPALLGALLLAASLAGRAELVALGDAVVRQEREIRRLEEERAELQIAAGAKWDLEAVERYAKLELGMHKPREDQILYGMVSLPDRVEVVERERPSLRERTALFREKLRHVCLAGNINCE